MEDSTEKLVDYVEDVATPQPLTGQKAPENPRMKYHFGRKVIEIPVSVQSVNEIIIHKYLPTILGMLADNVVDYIHFDAVYHIHNGAMLLYLHCQPHLCLKTYILC